MSAAEKRQPGLLLDQLLDGLVEVPATANRLITGLAIDSRRVLPGDLFLAVAGERQHGARFIPAAMAAGAVAVLFDDAAGVEAGFDGDVALLHLAALRSHASEIAGRLYGRPSQRQRVVGVTGTNGKTSISHFLAASWSAEEGRCGLLGTLGSGLYGALRDSGHTTPDAVTLQQELADLLAAGCRHSVMEVSSHALVQGRVEAVNFDTAIFSNLSHEHLDYHGDMEAYAAAKQHLFALPGLRRAVVNADDAVGREILRALPAAVEGWAYGLGELDLDVRRVEGSELHFSPDGLSLRVVTPDGEARLKSRLLGRFNAENLLAALAALLADGMPLARAVEHLERLPTVPGRMEAFGGSDGRPLVVVDYAHTPAALEHALAALREHCAGRLWCLFGCGGERDVAKRPLMGAAAERLADRVIVADDNPRGENPCAIIEAILSGMQRPDDVRVVRSRRDAIAAALLGADEEDVVLVAGKGHETTQQMGADLLAWSDREEVARQLGVSP